MARLQNHRQGSWDEESTVRKYTLRLEERGFITSEPTEVITRDGQMRNRNLLCTILPIQ